MQVIIFQQENGGVSVIIPTPDYTDQIEAVANKDVPKGRPWRIIRDSQLPSRDFRDQWQWTDSGPLTIKTEVVE